MESWVTEELQGCSLPDRRLHHRLEKLVGQLSEHTGQSIPLACQDWASTKAAYRFLDNDSVSECDILEGHFQATQARYSATTGQVLVLHDTTEFSYRRKEKAAIGLTTTTLSYKDGRPRLHTVCGILMHASLVITPHGLPLGLSSVKFWTRKKFKGTNRLKGKVNTARIPIDKKESYRWIENLRQSAQLLGAPERCVHIGDRESDIFELFCAAQEEGTHFLVRTCVDRSAEDGTTTIAKEMREERIKAVHRIEVRNKKGDVSTATLEIKYRQILVRPTIDKRKHYPDLVLNVIYAQERGSPKDRDPIEWKLLTDLPITCKRDAIEKLDWYASRWKIETFFKILKSGCKAEDLRLRKADRLANLISIFCILSWRIFWMTMLNRENPKGDARLAFTKLEIALLNKIASNSNNADAITIHGCITMLAQLGGYLARAHDPPPGNMVIWRGLSRLTDIEIGFTLGKNCG